MACKEEAQVMKARAKTVEIGEAKGIDLETKKYIVHARGNPAREALLIRNLRKRGWTQPKIAKAMGLSQSQISKREFLVNHLIYGLLLRLLKGQIRPSTAYILSKLPIEEQRRYGSKKKITLREVKEKRRNLTMSKDLISLLQAPITVPSRGSASELPDPEKDGKKYRKTACIFAVRMDAPFEVQTLEGTMTGKAGDYLAKGVKEELYPIAAEIFLKTYEAV